MKTVDIFEWKAKRGGSGSGNFGHEGRPGEQGGSGGGGFEKLDKFPNNFKDSITNVFKDNKNGLEKLFNDGQPTCYIATNEVVKVAEKNGVPVEVVDGEFEGSGHFFPIVSVKNDSENYDRYIVDIGNNIEKSAIETGNITPIITKYPDERYKVDKIMSPKQFRTYFNKLGVKLT